MPVLQIRGRNKPPIPDSQPGFGGGQVSYLRAALLQQNQCAGLLNVDILRLEDAVTRRGTDKLSTESASAYPVLGMAYYDISGTEKLVRVKADSISRNVETHDGTPASAWTTAAGWNPANANVEIAQGNGKLFFSNGTDNMRSWDGAAFTDMGTAFPNPPKCKYILYATNRLIAFGDPANPDTVYFSNILGEGVWSAAQSLRVGAGDGDEITGGILWTNTLLVIFKRSSAYLIDIDPLTTVANMPINTISRTIGCVGPRAFAKVGKDVWFYSDAGLRSLQRTLQGEDTEVTPALSYPVQDLTDSINQTAQSTICCCFYNDIFLLAVPTGAATSPDKVLPCRLISGTPRWLGQWTGWLPTIFVRSYISGAQRLNIGQSDGRVLRWRDFIRESDEAESDFQDAGAEIATQVLTRNMIFGDQSCWKQGFTLEAEFNQSRATISLTALLDGVTQASPVLTASTALGFLYFPITFPITFPASGIRNVPGTLMHTARFREIAFLAASTSKKMSLRRISATAFLQTMEARSTT